jgi:hypothetical protein
VGGHAESHNHGSKGCESHGKLLIVMDRGDLELPSVPQVLRDSGCPEGMIPNPCLKPARKCSPSDHSVRVGLSHRFIGEYTGATSNRPE